MTLFATETLWWIPCYGLVGVLFTLPWAIGSVKNTGPRPAAYFNFLMTALALIHALILWQTSWTHPAYNIEFVWFEVGNWHQDIILRASIESLGGVFLITLLSFLAQLFALGYMEKDWGLARFFALMGFFEGAMCGLALSDSLLASYGLLELLTLSTYLLVGFWYAQPLVVTAARDAFWTKRLGDMLLLMGVVALSTLAPSLNFTDLTAWAHTDGKLLSPTAITLLGFALIAGPIGKCAQFPLNLWLDEAMEGPNPASIMRNSVVVACGAYVLIRVQPILALSPVVMGTLVFIGALTAIGASWVALAQVDLKRAFCHSTSAYLGLVFIAVGLQQSEVALLLLFAHTLAKALLFMSIGSVIFTTSTQDLRELGGLGSRMPATTTAYLVAASGLVAGLPLGSFWALGAFGQILATAPFLLIILLSVNGLTAFNLGRVFGLVFMGPAQPKTRRAPEVPWTMAVPLVALTILTLLVPLFILQGHFTSLTLSLPVLLLVVSGVLGGWFGYQGTRVPLVLPKTQLREQIQDFLAHDLYVERFYRATIVTWISWGAKITAWLDRHIVDGAVNLVGLGSLVSGQFLRYANSGQSQTYVLTIVVGVIVVGVVELIITLH